MEDPATMQDSTKWEPVCETIPGQDITERLRVSTGWLYRTKVMAGATTGAAGQVTIAMSFVPDPLRG